MRWIVSSFTNQKKLYSTPLKNKRGFSLIEIMISIAVLAILTTIALPSLGEFIVKLKVDNKVSELQRMLLTARNTAINTGLNVSVCPINVNRTDCTGAADWSGVIGIISQNQVIKEISPINATDKLQFAFDRVTYNASGQLTANNAGTFSFCPHANEDFSRAVIISLSGRTFLSSDNNGDGKDQDRQGANIVCI